MMASTDLAGADGELAGFGVKADEDRERQTHVLLSICLVRVRFRFLL
jgi:hypothetical protein